MPLRVHCSVEEGMLMLRRRMTILFQGDSITDCRRQDDPEGLGFGHVRYIAAHLLSTYPELELRIVNRGISGNRVCDLQARWDKDCIELNPGLVTVLIGINETVRRFDENDPTSTRRFRETYHDILTRTRENTDAGLVLCEPFLTDVGDEVARWRADLTPRIDVVRDLAREFHAVLIPLDGLFAAASTRLPGTYWAADGVHPTTAGYGLITRAWLREVDPTKE